MGGWGGKYWGDAVNAAEEEEAQVRHRRWKLTFLKGSQRSHGVPGGQRGGLLLHDLQNLRAQEPLVYHNLVDKLREPIVRHDEVTYGDRKGGQPRLSGWVVGHQGRRALWEKRTN